MTSARTAPDWRAARRHLAKADPVMAGLIAKVGPCTLAPRTDYFVTLCKSILSQQISTIVAAVLFARLKTLFPRGRPTPAGLLLLDDVALRGVGLSRQKMVYLRDLAAHFSAGQIPVRRLAAMDDEQVIQALLPVKGIGRWTAEMFLIFVLNRTDVLPVDDLGLRRGMQRAWGLDALPTAALAVERAEVWRPYRSIATWYLWRGAA